MRTAEPDGMFDVIHAGLHGIFTRQQQHIVITHLLDDGYFLHDFTVRKGFAHYLVVVVETAVNAMVAAGIGQIHRDIELHNLAEPLLGQRAAHVGHHLQIRLGCRRNKCLEILQREHLLGKGPAHIMVSFGINAAGHLLPNQILYRIVKFHLLPILSLYQS